ncbi:hypothetical protein G6F26_002000 [Rhizopus arrhizus]|nr:hypothetical protein G6F18_000039 [Rhizopus arrhizus]KAG0915838.1 hypothetical protein G6F33_002967 [Rhizopus arrhizus]KAG0996577.1 hypothetical protein G6F28_003720 [Rhizopus arrhizus]KAG1013134.1 hypothetical protein G6F27_002161 [Rhizopus arrhizus]KAG1029118.1 hypothetical protein G6F26_002000 [Rhizopus arrhizus]
MAKIEDNKRRSSDTDEQGVSIRPPPKKRFMTQQSSTDDQEDVEESADTFKEPLEAFRKEAILRQWKDYLRSANRWKKYVEQAEANNLSNEEYMRLWEDSFKKLQTFLSNIIQDGMSSFGETSLMNIDNTEFQHVLEEEWLTELTPNMLSACRKKDFVDLTISKLNQLVKTWIAKRKQIITGFDSVFENGSLKDIQQGHQDVLSVWTNGQQSLQDIKNQLKLKNFKHLILKEECRVLNKQLETIETNLHQAQLDLEKLQSKKFSNHSEDVKMDIEGGSSGNASGTYNTAPGEGSITPYNSQTASQQDPLIHIQQILEQRLHEIDMIKEDRIVLKQQIAKLQMDLVCVPESRIYKAPLCRQLFQSRTYQKDKCNHLSDICHDLQISVEDLSSNRRRFIRDLDYEQVSHFKEMEDQLKKLDLDLTRIRGQRDALQMNLEEGKASTEIGRLSIVELKTIADARKERVNYLETELLRLQKKMAANTGISGYYEIVSNGKEPSLLPLENELKLMEEKVLEYKERVRNKFPQENIEQELERLFQIKQLQLKAKLFEEKYEFDLLSIDDVQTFETSLQDRIRKEKSVISEVNNRLSALKATEKQLLSEIESVAKAYGDLEDENIKKVQELASLEDEIMRLQTERVKYSQIFTALNKSKDAHAMLANALNKQIEKQLAHIKQMTEREKNLTSQVTCLDRKLATSNSIYEVYKQKNDEVKVLLDKLKEKALVSKDKITELQKSIFEKIRLIEEGAHARLRLEESREILKRKMGTSSKIEKPAEMKLRKEREEYRSLLNCNSCKTRLKSHVLMRCMHTFCKECLDVRIETRQRRCPSCGESFSVNDVKQFYF